MNLKVIVYRGLQNVCIKNCTIVRLSIYGVPFVSKLLCLLMGRFFSKNRLGSYCYLLKIDSVFVACQLKTDLVFVTCLQKSTRFLYATKINLVFVNCNNRFGFCSSLAKIDSIFVPCKNRLGFYNMHKNRIGSLMDRLGFCCTQNIDSQFYSLLCGKSIRLFKNLQTLDNCSHFY